MKNPSSLMIWFVSLAIILLGSMLLNAVAWDPRLRGFEDLGIIVLFTGFVASLAPLIWNIIDSFKESTNSNVKIAQIILYIVFVVWSATFSVTSLLVTINVNQRKTTKLYPNTPRALAAQEAFGFATVVAQGIVWLSEAINAKFLSFKREKYQRGSTSEEQGLM